MTSESNIGARITLIGKAAFLSGLKEASAAVAAANKEMAASAESAAVSQQKWYGTLAESQAAYRAETAATAEAQTAAYASMGKKVAFGLGAAAALVAYEGLKIHASFQSAMLQTVNLAGLSQSRLGALTAGIKAMSPAVNQGLTPLANALYRIASTPAGLKATNAQLLNMTKLSAQLATIGGPGTDLEQTARIMGGAMTVGVKGTGTPQDIVNLAAATVGSGDIRMSDYVDFLGTGVLTSAKLSGVTMPQIGAFLALAGSNLQSGQVSGHALAHGLMMMAAPTPTAQKAMGAIGLGSSALGDTMQTKGLGAGVAQLAGALRGPLGRGANTSALSKYGFSASDIQMAQTIGMGQMGAHGQVLMEQVLTRMFGGAKMGIPLNMLVTEQGQYQSTLAHMQSQMGNKNLVPDAMARQMDTLGGKATSAKLAFQNLADTIGRDLTPTLTVFLGGAADTFTWLSKNIGAAAALGGVITAILGPAIGIYLVRKFSDAAGAISTVVKGYANAAGAILRFLGLMGTEDAALATNDAALGANAAAENADAAATTRADAAAAARGSALAAGTAGAGAGATGASVAGATGGGGWLGMALEGAAKYAGPGALGWEALSKAGTTTVSPDTAKWMDTHPNGGFYGGRQWTAAEVQKMRKSLDPLYDRKPSVTAAPHPSFDFEPHSTGLTGGNMSSLMTPPPVHVYIDGREVFSAVQAQSKKVAARN